MQHDLMEVRDIVNRDLVNLTNCESEPIHIPGSIQPHGFLIGVEQTAFRIHYCSQNIDMLLDKSPREILGKDLHEIFGLQQAEDFIAYSSSFGPDTNPFNFRVGDVPYSTTIYRSGNYFLLELEPFPDGKLALPDLFLQTKTFVSMIENTKSLKDLCQAVAEETKRITGYDRVMVYKFDKDYNGEVFAEAKNADLEPFLGLHYPHTDIPAQARQLYMRNLLRMIVDVDYTPVPLLTDLDGDEAVNLDLSDSVLRSVSPIHIQYLKNMGVGGTMSISLMHNRKLWGLIACHHYAAKNIPHFTRLAAKLQGHFLTSQIDVRESLENLEATEKVNQTLTELVDEINHITLKDFQKFFTRKAIFECLKADGAVIIDDGIQYPLGDTPAASAISDLAGWCFRHARNGRFITNHLSAAYPPAAAFKALASGIIYHNIGASEKDCIIWFRREHIHTVNWAGDPAKSLNKGETVSILTPRKSFELFKESVDSKSTEWTSTQTEAASKISVALQRQFLLLDLKVEEERYRLAAEKLQAANEELKNINWISAHDLKEPIRKIQFFADKILTDSADVLDERTTKHVTRMKQIAVRMKQLLSDLVQYSEVSNKEVSFEQIDLNQTFREVLSELAEDIEEKGGRITVAAMPVIQGIEFQIHQLLHNLLQNAIKFASPDRQLVITIGYQLVDNLDPEALLAKQYHQISITDNGIGFDNIYAKRIFEIFQMLQRKAETSGTGIGLAICKKIAENHNGYLKASGAENAGAEFIIGLPVSSQDEQTNMNQ